MWEGRQKERVSKRPSFHLHTTSTVLVNPRKNSLDPQGEFVELGSEGGMHRTFGSSVSSLSLSPLNFHFGTPTPQRGLRRAQGPYTCSGQSIDGWRATWISRMQRGALLWSKFAINQLTTIFPLSPAFSLDEIRSTCHQKSTSTLDCLIALEIPPLTRKRSLIAQY